jgi:hypothetical protein
VVVVLAEFWPAPPVTALAPFGAVVLGLVLGGQEPAGGLAVAPLAPLVPFDGEGGLL